MGRPVLFEEAMNIDMSIIEDNELNTYNILRVIYRMCDNEIKDENLREEIKLKLREAAVFERRITNKLINVYKVKLDDFIVTDEEALAWGNDNDGGGMEFVSRTQWTYCEVLREIYRLVNKLNKKLCDKFQLMIRKATVHGTKLSGKLNIGRPKTNDSLFGYDVFWINK